MLIAASVLCTALTLAFVVAPYSGPPSRMN
jgi:hypothetical protein